MNAEYGMVRALHIIGACVLLGTGAGIAFFMLLAHRTRDPKLIAHVAQSVVVGDALFTATAVVLQPITGVLLARHLGWSLAEPWLALSLVLYVVAGVFWLPVIWMQLQIRNIALWAVADGNSLPERYFWLFRAWFWSGFPAFGAVLGIIWLMVTRPSM